MMRETIKIGARAVGKGQPAYIIAEIGSNHDGDVKRAKELIGACKYAGADAVKFQSFTAEGLLSPLKPNGNGNWVLNPAYKLIEDLTMPPEWHAELKECAEGAGMTFLSAPFDDGRADLLNSIGVAAFKIASGDITDEPLLRKIASYKKPVVLSTGASYMEEVRRAVEVLTDGGSEEIALLHCSALYPPAFEDVNLLGMRAIAKEFKCPVGFSDHTPGSAVPVASVALGASIIEKHITLSRKLSGPDHPYAMEVDEFRGMVSDIRNIEKALGDGVKKPSHGEMMMRTIARRGIYARKDIKKGEVIGVDMLKVVRQASGLAPSDIYAIAGKTASRDLKKDMPVAREDLCL